MEEVQLLYEQDYREMGGIREGKRPLQKHSGEENKRPFTINK